MNKFSFSLRTYGALVGLFSAAARPFRHRYESSRLPPARGNKNPAARRGRALSFLAYLRGFFFGPPRPKVTRVYRERFNDGVLVRLTLCTRKPRYVCEFAHPLSDFLRQQFEDFRAAAIADFEKRTGVKIGFLEMRNERVRPPQRSTIN